VPERLWIASSGTLIKATMAPYPCLVGPGRQIQSFCSTQGVVNQRIWNKEADIAQADLAVLTSFGSRIKSHNYRGKKRKAGIL